jgi:hypothetical protein
VRQTNFFYLLIALLLVLVSIPLADDLGLTDTPLIRTLIFSGVLIIGVWSLKGGGRAFSIGMAFAVIGVVLNVIAANTDSAAFQLASNLALIGFFVVAITYTLKQVAIGTDINANRLVGAVCVYLLFGVIWAMLYTLVETLTPGSFAGFTAMDERGWDSEWLYFSFVTMTTLGYGDILPISATARGLAYMQAVVGQFYIAMLVAGLVGAYISDRQKAGSD